jgi:hypothetical protein
MNDDVDGAEEGLSQGNSSFHKVCDVPAERTWMMNERARIRHRQNRNIC